MSESFATRLADLDKEARNEYLSKLSEEDLKDLIYTWRYWARPEQLTPPGNWNIWLIMCGRGWGKTRTAAEDVKTFGLAYANRRIAIVAPTFGDGRDTCVEGESGLLHIIPPNKLDTWNRSLGELVLTNGTRYKIFSAKEPERLRGPQHHRAWCLAGDTPVLMADGSQKPIANMCVGEYVMTRDGARRVTGHCMTKQNTEVYLLCSMDGRSIIGTADHPVWVEGRGFVPMSLLSKGMSLCVMPVLNGTVISGISAENTTLRTSGSTEQFGSKPMDQFPKVPTFTTRTAIKRTIGWRTWNYLPTANIVLCTMKRSLVRTARKRFSIHSKRWREITWRDWNECLSALSVAKSTIVLPSTQRAFARQSALRLAAQTLLTVKRASVSIVQLSTVQQSGRSDTVRDNVMVARVGSGRPHLKSKRLNVTGVTPHSSQSGQMPVSVNMNAPYFSTQSIASVEKLAKRSDVYDIAIEDAHEFFANGILVHNCDELCSWQYPEQTWDNLMLTMRLPGIRPQTVIATTPKPTKLLKSLLKRKGKDLHFTSGSTFDNEMNLAPEALAELKERYANTRKGLQELYAAVLDDVEGALWNRERLDLTRVINVPAFIRIVIGVDPATTNEPGSDETGIIVVALGEDGHFYVLADHTIKASPKTWAEKIVAVCYLVGADRIACESNQGGDLLETVIRAVDGGEYVPYRKKHASESKYLRAEPVAALYEQGRAHHVGFHAELEDEQCTWVPGSKSPNRLDALVWAIKELLESSGTIPLVTSASLRRPMAGVAALTQAAYEGQMLAAQTVQQVEAREQAGETVSQRERDDLARQAQLSRLLGDLSRIRGGR